MYIVCLDLEGVLVPEIWIALAEKTGIEELRLTTRDIADYDVLMKKRIGILGQNAITLSDIQAVIETIDPLPGAEEFMAKLRPLTQVIILSDTFTQFATPLMRKLGWPTLFCNSLVVDDADRIVDYTLRQTNGKMKAASALQQLGYQILAAGDSYNDLAMLQAANRGILFRPPASITREYPQIPVTEDHEQLFDHISAALSEPAHRYG